MGELVRTAANALAVAELVVATATRWGVDRSLEERLALDSTRQGLDRIWRELAQVAASVGLDVPSREATTAPPMPMPMPADTGSVS
jgi:hypothetical protein